MNRHDPRRRAAVRFAAFGVALPAAGLGAASLARAADDDSRRVLRLHHTHTGETLSLVYAIGARYLEAALTRVNHFLRDHYSGTVGTMDPGLLDQIHRLAVTLGAPNGFEVISGYRSPATNEALRRRGGGGVATRSLHLEGRAIDIRLPGVALADLRDAALEARAGGVGYYADSNFVHIDTGRVRRW